MFSYLIYFYSMPNAISPSDEPEILENCFPKMDRWAYETIKLMKPSVVGLYTEGKDGFMVPCSRASTSTPLRSFKLDENEQVKWLTLVGFSRKC